MMGLVKFSTVTYCIICLFTSLPLLGQSHESILKSILAEEDINNTVAEETVIPENRENTVPPTGEEDDSGPEAATPDQLALKMGIELYNSRLFDRAMEKFTTIKNEYPRSPYSDSASIWTSRILMERGNYKNALKELSGIPEKSGEYPASLFLRGQVFKGQGQRIPAIESFKTVSALFPEHELADDALLQTAELYLQEKQGTQSLDAVLKIIKYYGERETIDDAYYWLGAILLHDPVHKDVESARKIFKIFLKRAEDPGNRHFHNSPLADRATRDLRQIESIYFQEE